MSKIHPPVIPTEIIANLRAFAVGQSVTGMGLWHAIKAANPRANFDDDGDYGMGEMCAEVITNNLGSMSIFAFEDDLGKMLISSEALIRILDGLKDNYDIVNYEVRDGRVWAIEEQCWADEL